MEKLASIERSPDGCLPRMTPRQRQAAVKLIRATCHDYDNGSCLLLDNACCQVVIFHTLSPSVHRLFTSVEKKILTLK